MLKRWLRTAIRRVRGDLDLDDYRRAGAVIAEGVLENGLIINKNDCFLVTIEEGVVLGPEVLILAHDASLRPELGYTRVAPVMIGRGSFIGARSILMPGSVVGRNCIIAAGSVVTGSTEDDSVYGGVPARRLGSKAEQLAKWKNLAAVEPKFDEGWKSKIRTQRSRESIRSRIGSSGWVY